MNKCITIVILIFSVFISKGQNFLTISGTITDAETSEPLPFASIGIKNQAVSTVSNLSGEFSFHLPDGYNNDTLYISVIGYDRYEIPLSKVQEKSNLTIALKPAAHYLNEVTIVDSLSAQEILKRAINRIKINYPTTPFLLEAFYREIQQANHKYVSLIEVALELYGEGYGNPKHHKIKVIQLRRSLGYTHPYNDFFKHANLLWEFMTQDDLKYSLQSLKKYKAYQRLSNTSLEGKPVYVLETKDSFYWPKRLYIQCDNYAIVRVEEYYGNPHKFEQGWTSEKETDSIRIYPKDRSLRVDYKMYNEKYYLHFIGMNYHHAYRNMYSQQLLFEHTVQQNFVITKIITGNITPISRKEGIRPDSSLAHYSFPYDVVFWKHYNVIKETPVDKKIYEELEQQSSLEEQFKTSGHSEKKSPVKKSKKENH